MAKQETKRGAAYDAVRFIYDKSPGRSWLRLNTALAQVLDASITAHLSFEVDDFDAMRSNMSGHYWMGNSTGSVCGERFYCHAVKVGHTPACLSFEKYAERPPALWVEDVKTPERLCVGSDFTWEGLRVQVTSMAQDALTACYYENKIDRSDEAQVGDGVYLDREYRKIERIVRAKGKISVRLGDVVNDNRKPTKRFTIPYADLMTKRKAFDAARKDAISKIAAAETPARLTVLSAKLSKFKWRPFDVTELRAAVSAQSAALKAGKRPGDAVEHVNGDPCDNRPENLRVVTLAENNR
jgi:HNH endonuclease